MGKRYENQRKAVTENRQTLDKLKSDSDILQKEYAPFVSIDGLQGLLDDEVADLIHNVSAVEVEESERIDNETNAAEKEKEQVTDNINSEIGKLTAGLDKLRRASNLEFGKQDVEQSKREYRRQIDKLCGLIGELEGTCRSSSDSSGHAADSLDTENANLSVENAIKDILDQNVTTATLPTKGSWSGKRGNSTYLIDDDVQIRYPSKSAGQRVTISGKQLKSYMITKYGTDTVTYTSKEPNFAPFEDEVLGHALLETFPASRTEKGGGTYKLAEQQIASRLITDSDWVSLYQFETGNQTCPTQKDAEKWIRNYMDSNDLTWHECADRHTVRPVPTVINAAFKHGGGISSERSVRAMRETWRDEYDAPFALQRYSMEGRVDISEFERACSARRKEYADKKRRSPGN